MSWGGKLVGREVVVAARAVWTDFLITSCLCPKHFLLPSCTTGPWGKADGQREWGRGDIIYMWEKMNEKRGKKKAVYICSPMTEMPGSDSSTNVYFINHLASLQQMQIPVVGQFCQKLEYRKLRGEVSCKACITCLCVREENNTTLPLVAGGGLFSGVWSDQMTTCFHLWHKPHIHTCTPGSVQAHN